MNIFAKFSHTVAQATVNAARRLERHRRGIADSAGCGSCGPVCAAVPQFRSWNCGRCLARIAALSVGCTRAPWMSQKGVASVVVTCLVCGCRVW